MRLADVVAAPLAMTLVLTAVCCREAGDAARRSESAYPAITPTIVSTESQVVPRQDVLRVEFGASFGGNNVALSVDGKAVFSGAITTAPHGVAHSMSLPWSSPRVLMVVVVDGRGWRCSVDLSQGRCLQIDYREGQLEILQSVHGLPHT
jgi:hypothetical protein